MGPTKKLTSIDSTIGKNSKAEMDNQLTSQTSQENEKFKNKTRNGIARRNAILRKVKESPPINESGMTNKLTDSTNGLKKIPKPLPDLPHGGLNFKVRQSKPLPQVPTTHKLLPQIHSQPLSKHQPQQPQQPQPQIAILAKTLDVGLIVKQMKLFKNAINSQDGSQAELLAEQLNKYASDDKKVSAGICCKFAINIEKLARPNFNFTPEIKQSLVQFSSAWIAMKSAQGDPKGSAWDIVINTMALSIQEKSKEWSMEF
jgi:hypothetical protein